MCKPSKIFLLWLRPSVLEGALEGVKCANEKSVDEYFLASLYAL